MRRRLHDYPPPRIGRIIALLVMLTGLVTVAAPMTSAHASTASSGKKTACAVHDVAVSPNKPAIFTCKRWVITTDGIVAYSVSEDRCSNYGLGYQLSIVSYSRGVYCFWGSGYVGLGTTPSNTINDATEVSSLCYEYDNNGGFCSEYGSGWVMYYFYPWTAGTGHQFYFGGGGTYNSGNSVFGPTTKVTQVYLNPHP